MSGRLVRRYAVFEGIQVVTVLVSLNLTGLVETVKLGVVVGSWGAPRKFFMIIINSCICIS